MSLHIRQRWVVMYNNNMVPKVNCNNSNQKSGFDNEREEEMVLFLLPQRT